MPPATTARPERGNHSCLSHLGIGFDTLLLVSLPSVIHLLFCQLDQRLPGLFRDTVRVWAVASNSPSLLFLSVYYAPADYQAPCGMCVYDMSGEHYIERLEAMRLCVQRF